MTKPADKWMQKADELIFANSTGWVERGPKEWAKLRQAIARALEATDKAAREEERERCVKIANEQALDMEVSVSEHQSGSTLKNQGLMKARAVRAIAAAIRKGTE